MCNCVQVSGGIPIVYAERTCTMANCFMAGGDLVRWELTALGNEGPYRLAMHHGQGSIVEYFQNVAEALAREGQLETLLIAARTSTHLVEA